MGTTADKLAYLEGTKTAIRDAIAARGVDVPESTAFRDYAGKIGEISGGGSADPLDPEFFYSNFRPKDWIPMPEPGDDEMYLLMHLPNELVGYVAFTVHCTGIYTVEKGCIRDGAYMSASTQTLESGSTYEEEIDSNWSTDPTTDDMLQVLLRVRGTGITSWELAPRTGVDLPYTVWNIVDIACRLPSCTKMKLGAEDYARSLTSLRYFAWFGPNQMSDMTGMFSGCRSLRAVRALDTSSVTNMNSAFSDCSSLTALPALETSQVTTLSKTFENCMSLTELPAMDLSAVQDFSYAFYGCRSLRSLEWLRASSGQTFEFCFFDCTSLRTLSNLSLDGHPGDFGFQNAFYGCYSLEKVTFATPQSTWSGCDMIFEETQLSYFGVLALLYSLPFINGTKTIYLAGTPGARNIVEKDIQLATDKGWILVY